MTNFANVIFPQNVPLTGIANRIPQTAAPATAVANRSGPINPPAPTTIVPTKIPSTPTTQITSRGLHVPITASAIPVVGQSIHTPIPTPIGTSPEFETPTEVWSWVNGNGS